MKTIKLPKFSRDWKGDDIAIAWPAQHKPVAHCGSVYLLQNSRNPAKFCVVYGLEVKPAMSYTTAASQFGFSCMHEATCEGLLKDAQG